MTLQREHIVNGAVALALVGAGVWIAFNTEWVEVQVPVAPRGEAARDPHYAVKQLVRRLGGEVRAPLNLERLPPPGATLVLSSWHWNIFPERELALRRWVEAGGHLVVQDWTRDKSLEWVPIETVSAVGSPRASNGSLPPRAASAPAAPPRRAPFGLPAEPPCHEAREASDAFGAYGEPRSYRLCVWDAWVLRSRVPVSWSLLGPRGAELLRVAVGQGSVTAINTRLTDNRRIVEADHALAFVAALRLRAGDTVWFVDSETRTPLLAAIWQSGAPAVLLGALALAAALWRGGVRFGPRAPSAAPARRSVAEQIRGTAAFVFSRNGAALHRAQLRALEDAARRRIRDHDRLDRASRAQAIASFTALDAGALARAMDPSPKRPRRELTATLAMLETAARRLTLNRS